jgi:hypothetical protein
MTTSQTVKDQEAIAVKAFSINGFGHPNIGVCIDNIKKLKDGKITQEEADIINTALSKLSSMFNGPTEIEYSDGSKEKLRSMSEDWKS